LFIGLVNSSTLNTHVQSALFKQANQFKNYFKVAKGNVLKTDPNFPLNMKTKKTQTT